MRKLKLFMATFALVGGSVAAMAQTDVTSTYLTNADFSSTEGWTEVVSGQFRDYGNGLIGEYTVRFSPATVDETHLATEYCFGLECRWNTNYASYTQTTSELPVGMYTLTFDVENVNGSTTKATYENRFFVEIGDNKIEDSSKEWMSGKSAWTTHTISFAVTEASTATISLGYGTGSNNIGADNTPALYVSHLKLTYQSLIDGVKADLTEEIEKAKALEVAEADAAALNTAISTAEGVLTSGTTEQDFLDAVIALKVAENLAVNGMTSASATNGIATNLIVNGTFDSGINGWSRTGTYQNNKTANNQTGAFTGNFYENWNGAAQVNKMYQVVENVPNGTYRLKIAAFVNKLDDPNDSQFVYANDDKVYLKTGEPTAYEVWTVVTTNKIEVGLNQTEAIANWMGIDNVSLSYFGAGNVIDEAKVAAAKPDWEAAKQAAEDALASTDYANVTGDEKSALQAEVEKSEPSSEDAYLAAIEALTAATTTFKAAKASYDQLAAANEALNSLETLPYADSDLLPSAGTASTAADAATAAAAIYPAIRAYVESNAVAASEEDAVNYDAAIADANADKNTGWTKGIGTNQGQGYTDAAGTVAAKYLDGGWSSSAGANIDMTREVIVPAGRYLLTVTARGSVDLDEYTLSIGGNSIVLPHISNTGGVFGNGWNDASIEFESEGEPLTLEIIAKSTATQQWISINRFRLVQLYPIEVPMADETDYANLASAIETAEGHALGFESGEYAPYNNVEAVKALQAAKAIDPEAVEGNTKKVVDAAIEALSYASWEPNSDDVDIVYNGMYATVTEGANYPQGWKRTNGWGQMQSGLSGDYETAYYNQPGSMQYGNQGAYLMPLAANTSYKLTFSYRSHEWDSNKGVTVSILKGDAELKKVTFPGVASTEEWSTVSTVFTTTDADNYVLSLGNSGNTWMTNVSIVKATPESVTVTSDGYATYVSDYDLDFSATAIKAYTAKVEDGKVVLTQIEKVAAGTPVVLCCKGGQTEEIPFANTTDTPAESDLVAGNGATVATTDGTYTNYILNNGKGIGFYQANDQTVDKGRAYLHVAGTSEARLAVVFGDATGISSVKAAADGEAVYNLNGQRVKNASKGLFIIGGKKVVVK